MKQIGMRQMAHMAKYPNAEVISLGVGDTTEPIPSVVAKAMAKVILYFLYKWKDEECLTVKEWYHACLVYSFRELSSIMSKLFTFLITSDNSLLGN
jgi:hypothetical protein